MPYVDESTSFSIAQLPINVGRDPFESVEELAPPHVRRTDISNVVTEPDWSVLAPSGWYATYGKHLLDAALMCLVLPIALPLALIIALVNAALHGSIGKILFTQPRIGLHNRVFTIYKFRTMKDDSHGSMSSWSTGGDHLRVTAFGRFLRNSHLDELPQLINILRGDMAFIGPRPEMLEVEAWACESVPGFSRRLAIRPGITGLAQITQGYVGRDVAGYAKKLELNEHYRRHYSVATDLRIIARTALWMLRFQGWRWHRAA